MIHANRNDPAAVQYEEVEVSAAEALSGTPEGATNRVTLLVLSRDEAVVQAVRRAAPRSMRVVHAPDLDQIASTLSTLRPGVLVADVTDAPNFASTVAQLTQHFPELVCVAAGKVSEKNALMKLTAAGTVFRFLLTPLTHGQTHLALEAAHARHLELQASANRLASGSLATRGGGSYVAAYAKLAIGLIVVIGAVWWGVTKLTGTSEPEAGQLARSQPDVLPAERPDPVQAELRLAKEAFDAGRYLEPAGESALDLYRSALALDPDNEAARAGIRAVADKVLERAEVALTNGQLEAAVRSIESAREIDATHPRISFLDIQIAREHERLKLSRAQDITERVSTFVAQAYDRMQRGNLYTPAGESARDALLAARRLDPTDPTVIQGLRDLTTNIVEAARRAADAGATSEAQQHVEVARGLGARGANLAAVERAIAAAARRAAAPTQNLTARSTAPATQPAVQTSAQSGTAVAPSPPPTAAPNAPRSNAQAGGANVAPNPPPAQPTNTIVQAAELPRIRQVAPRYPARAAMNGTEGWVDIEFTIGPDGVPTNLSVKESRPRQIFNQAALQALEQWRFQPTGTAQRAIIRLRFELEN